MAHSKKRVEKGSKLRDESRKQTKHEAEMERAKVERKSVRSKEAMLLLKTPPTNSSQSSAF